MRRSWRRQSNFTRAAGTRIRKIEQLEPRWVLDSTVVFSELMYHPRGDDAPEWIELHNSMSVDMDISEWSLTGGIEYEFPADTVISGGGYLVISSDPDAVGAAAGLDEVHGPFLGRLSNDGESITLLNNSGRRMDQLEYRDRGDWPVGPDGSGATLAKAGRFLATSAAENWETSEQLGGTPGRENFSVSEPERISRTLVDPQSSASLLLPTDGLVDAAWRATDYVENSLGESWQPVTASIGFNRSTDAPSYEEEVAADSPLVHWRLAENSDAATAANSGILAAAVDANYDPMALRGQPSLLGDPSDKAIRLSSESNQPALESSSFEKLAMVDGVGGAGRSIEFWMSLESIPTGLANLVGDGESALDFGLLVYITEEARIRVYARTTNAADFGVSSVDSQRQLTVGDAVHVVATWDITSGELQLYIDGARESLVNPTGVVPTIGSARNTTNRMFVGVDQRNSRGVEAIIDEIAVYNYRIGADRIAAHHNAGQATFETLIGNDIEAAMFDNTPAAYLRIPFDFTNDIEVDLFSLTAQYDDGFVAYLNGAEVARRFAPAAPTFAANATTDRTVGESLVSDSIDLLPHVGLLQRGTNVLAIHGMNFAADNPDFLFTTSVDVSGLLIPPAEKPAVVISEVSSARDDSFHIELHNSSATTVDLQGFVLDRDGTLPQSFLLPAMSLAPGAYVDLSSEATGLDADDGGRLFLYSTDRAQLLDARRVTNRLRGLMSDGQWLYPSEPTFGQPNVFALHDEIVINEIMYHARPQYATADGQPFVESNVEWIELYNRGPVAVDLSGWQLNDAVGYTFGAGATIEPGGFLLVTNDRQLLSSRHPDAAEMIAGEFSGSLSNQGERIQLLDASGNPADVVQYYDSGYWPHAADGGGSSLELRDPDSDNQHAAAWAASNELARSQWQTYRYRGTAVRPSGSNFPTTYDEFSFGLLDAGEILIDDIQVVEAPDEAALNLIQNSEFTGSLEKWRDVGNHHATIVTDPLDPTNDVLHLVANGPEEHLQNHVETTLKSGNSFRSIRFGTEYEISFRAKWLSGSPQLNTRLFFNVLPQTTILEQPSLSGTPGRANSTAVANAGPTLTGLSHHPVSPLSGESVIVSARATDADSVQAATLWYSVDESAWQSVPMSISADGETVGVLPGQRTDATVQFYITAQDSLGAQSAFPPQAAESSALYRVGPPSTSTTGLQNLSIIVTQSTESLLGLSTNLMSNDRLGATVVYEGTAFYDVGVRLKGSEHGRADRNRRGFSLEFQPDQLFRGVHPSIGIDRSGGWRFGRTFGQDEILVYQFFNRAGGIPSMYNDLVYVDAPTTGKSTAMIQLARYTDTYLDEQYDNGSDGTRYEYELIYTMLPRGGVEAEKAAQEGPSVFGIPVGRDFGENREYYRHNFLIKNNLAEDEYRGMIALAQAFSERSTTTFLENVGDVIDVDQWLRAFAALSLSGANDNYNAGAQHNASFYERPEDGKMLLFPFDMDFAFINSPTDPFSRNGDLNRLLRSDTNEHHFLGHVHDIISTSFNREYMGGWAGHYDALLGGQGLPSIVSWVDQRVNSLLGRLPDQVEFAIALDDLTTDAAFVTLTGEGWINVREIVLAAGATPLDVTWTSPTAWQAVVPVATGTHVVTLTAIDFQGQTISSDTVNITSSAVNPVAGSLVITELNYNPYEPTPSESMARPGLDNDAFEFIEVQNVGSAAIQTRGLRFRDGIEFVFPDAVLNPGQYAVIVQDADAFALRYGSQIPVLGEFDAGRLNNDGESLTVVDALNNIIIDLAYTDSDPWPVRADGAGASLELTAPGDTPASELAKYYRWRGSTEYGGSPASLGGSSVEVVINEVLSNSDAVGVFDSIELYNAGESTVDLTGAFLSDSANDLLKFAIPAGTILEPGQYVVFDERDFNPTPLNPGPRDFALAGSRGDDVWLVKADADGVVTAFWDDVHFGATASGQSIGTAAGAATRLVPLQATTLGAANADAALSPLFVSEIHYHPAPASPAALAVEPSLTPDDLEYIELHNASPMQIDLTNWRIQGEVEFEFAEATVIGPRETIAILSFNPLDVSNERRLAGFRTEFSTAANIRIGGGFAGQLSDSAGVVQLQQPELVPGAPAEFAYITVDEFVYDDLPPWARETDGQGNALARSLPLRVGNDPSGWSAAAPSPGVFNDAVNGDLDGDGSVDTVDVHLLCGAVGMANATGDLDGDGSITLDDMRRLLAILGTSFGDSNVDGRFNSTDLVLAFQRGEYEDTTPSNSIWSDGDWNCDGDFASSDLVLAFQDGGYAANAVAAVRRDPEYVSAAAAVATSKATGVSNLRQRFVSSAKLDGKTASRVDRRQSTVAVVDLLFADLGAPWSDDPRGFIDDLADPPGEIIDDLADSVAEDSLSSFPRNRLQQPNRRQ